MYETVVHVDSVTLLVLVSIDLVHRFYQLRLAKR